MNGEIRDHIDPEAPLYIPRRFLHRGCSEGKDRAAIITRFPDRWKWYCHRCGKAGVVDLQGLPLSYKVKAAKANRRPPPQQRVREVRLPHDFTLEIPPEGLVWLWDYFLDEKEIEHYGIGYSPSLRRVILPVYQDQELVYWQGRWVDKPDPDQPKYINVAAVGRGRLFYRLDTYPYNHVVLVEDILSAIAVHRVTNSIALLYAYVPDDLVKQLVEEYGTVIIWLDPDKNSYTLKKVRRLRAFGWNVHRITSFSDPKCYPIGEISTYLNAVLERSCQ